MLNMITQIIGAIQQATNYRPQAFSSNMTSSVPCITYTLYKQSDNAVIQVWRLQLRFTAKTLQKCMEMSEAASNALCSLGDEEVLGALNIKQNGGGTLEDDLTCFPQVLSFYDIQIRS